MNDGLAPPPFDDRKPQSRFFTPIKVILAAAGAFLLIAATAGGFILWQQLAYQHEEADRIMEQALAHLDTAHGEADQIIRNLEKVNDRMSNDGTGPGEPTRQDTDYIQRQIDQARDSMSVIGDEVEAFDAALRTATALKLKNDYRAYLETRSSDAGGLREFGEHADKAFSILDQLVELQSAEIDFADKYERIEAGMDPMAFRDQTRELKADLESLIELENELVESGVLSEKIAEVQEFDLGCVEKSIQVADAAVAKDGPAFDRAVTDLETSCNDRRTELNDARYAELWEKGWSEFYEDAIEEAREKNGSPGGNKIESDEFQYTV